MMMVVVVVVAKFSDASERIKIIEFLNHHAS